jgi:hypothetical protein
MCSLFFKLYRRILRFADRAPRYSLINKANLVHNYFLVCLFLSLQVLGEYVPIIRRNNCIYATLGPCYSVWMTVWYAGWDLFHPVYLRVSLSSNKVISGIKYSVSCFYIMN